MNLKYQLLTVLNTVKNDEETWSQLFERYDKEKGFDQKTSMSVLALIIEYLEEKDKVYVPSDR